VPSGVVLRLASPKSRHSRSPGKGVKGLDPTPRLLRNRLTPFLGHDPFILPRDGQCSKRALAIPEPSQRLERYLPTAHQGQSTTSTVRDTGGALLPPLSRTS
jgi:hypothetical protein